MSSFKTDALTVHVLEDEQTMAKSAAETAGRVMEEVIAARGSARIVLATAASQVSFYQALVANKGIDWSRITVFHLDEFLGLSEADPAGFGFFLTKHLLTQVPLGNVYKLRGDALLPIEECERYEALLREAPIDLCCVGIGENGHIAFNDPGVADFQERRWVKLVKLDARCREQQVKDKMFVSLEKVPLYAYTLTIPAICASRVVLGVAPGRHKAEAVMKTLQGSVSTTCPASILRIHPKASLYLDENAAERLLIA